MARAKQTISVTRTTLRKTKTPKSSSRGSSQPRCPSCGKYTNKPK